MAISTDQLFDAFNDALARIHEFDGAGIDAKLATFGLNAESLRDLLEDRWRAHVSGRALTFHEVFVQGFVEGLITGLQLRR